MPIARINGTSLHYHVSGDGPPIILIAPPLLTRAIFRYQTEELSDFFKVVTFDVRGHGMSAPSEAPVTYPLIAEDVRQLMNFLGIDKAFIGGYSTGAGVALEALLSYPDRFYGGILLSGMSEFRDAYNRTRLKLAEAMCKLEAKKALAYAICRGNADRRETFINLYREAMKGHAESWLQYYSASSEYNCTGRLSRIHHPMLLVYGKKDRSFYRYARMLHRELLLADLSVVKGASHQLPTKAHGAVNRLIRDWARSVLSRTENRAEREKERDTGEDWRLPAALSAMEGAGQADHPATPG